VTRRILTVAEFRELCLKEPYPYIGLITHDLALREQNRELWEALEAIRDINLSLGDDISPVLEVALLRIEKLIAKAHGESVKA
jgi:hypothetical protein